VKHLEKQVLRPPLREDEAAAQRGFPPDTETTRRQPSYVGAIVLAITLVGATGWGLSSMFGARHNDQVTDQDRAQRLATFSQIKAISLPAVKESELTNALESMKLSSKDRSALTRDLASSSAFEAANAAGAATPQGTPTPAPAPQTAPQKAALVWITLWDTHAQDGDIVQVQSGGYVQEVTLMNKPTRFAVPVPPNGVVNIVGIHDGGGGITLGAMSADNPVALPIMSEGQTLGIPVLVR
jgi:hypothetical protein